MKRPSRLFLPLILGFAFGLLTTQFVARPAEAFAGPASQDSRNWEKHNRKLLALEQKRIRKRHQLERDYQKLFERGKTIDGRKMIKLQEEFQKKLRKIDQDYYRKVQELERKRK
jgi:hypothetical protein